MNAAITVKTLEQMLLPFTVLLAREKIKPGISQYLHEIQKKFLSEVSFETLKQKR